MTFVTLGKVPDSHILSLSPQSDQTDRALFQPSWKAVMKRIYPQLLSLFLLVFVANLAAHAAGTATGKVTVTSPTGNLFSSSIHYTATATTTCPKGISAMGIYTAPYRRVYGEGRQARHNP